MFRPSFVHILLLLVAAASAFCPVHVTRPSVSTARHMFNNPSNNDKAKASRAKPLEEVSPLEEVNAADTAVPLESSSTPTKSYVKDLATGEVREVDWVRLLCRQQKKKH